MKTIYILVPVFNESGNLPKLVEELDKETAKVAGHAFKYLFVDDGSSDSTVEVIEGLMKVNPRNELVEFSRNFGKEQALTAGLDAVAESGADAVIIMDADLQHPPKHIPEFVEKWEAGWDIVATKRVSMDKQPLARRFGSYMFYKIMNSISSELHMEPQTTDFRLLDREVVLAMCRFGERNRIVRGIMDWVGFRKVFLDFESPERYSGQVGYSYTKLVRLAMNSMTSFSLFPLKIAGYLGLLITAFFGCLLVFMAADRFLAGNSMGFSNLGFVVVINSLTAGIVLSCLGLVALYIGNIYTEVVDRPLYIVRKRRSSDKPVK